MEKQKRILGCIADDFTGASDAASFLQKAGLQTVLLSGVPSGSTLDIQEYDAVVVALKTRTEVVEEAVAHTMEAVRWLEDHHVTNYYLKYCSTFDSTRKGNIGPVLDAMMEYFQESYTLICPSLPVNGRTVRDGHLYVNGVPLDESPMKDHPLTPMWDSRVKNLLEAQSKYSCVELGRDDLNEEAVKRVLEDNRDLEHFYIIPDYETAEDAVKIVELFGDKKILSGGSGLLEYLLVRENRGVVLAGSCSRATLEQIANYQAAGHASLQLHPEKLFDGSQKIEEVLEFVRDHREDYVLIYSSAPACEVKKIQKLGKEQMAQLLEETISELAKCLRDEGYRHIIVAGGETSGAVTKRLGYEAFQIGKSVAPGVPLMTPLEDRNMRLVLKSGNFGQPDFFERAVKTAKGE